MRTLIVTDQWPTEARLVAVDPAATVVTVMALDRLLGDPEEIARRKRESLAWAARHLGWARCAARTRQVYAEVTRAAAAVSAGARG
jgi:glycosyltransferase involved in cell wall biosynthesis